MLLKGAIILAVVSTAYCTDFKQCEIGIVPIKLQLNECTKEPCYIKAGSMLDSNITFDAPYDVEEFKNVAKVTFGSTSLDIPLDAEGCNHLYRGWCPLEVDERAIYNFHMEIPPFLPNLNLKLQIQLINVAKDGTEDTMVCFEVLITTIKPKNMDPTQLNNDILQAISD